MKRIFYVILFFLFYILLLKLPILKTNVDENNYYYKDMFGFIHIRQNYCGIWIFCSPPWDTPLIGAHITTFKTLRYNGVGCLDTYAKTNNAVYYNGKRQSQVTDPSSFELINNSYAKDNNNIYELCDLKILNNTPPIEFQLIGSVCSKSTTAVYCFKKKIDKADPETFSHVSLGYYRDKNHMYYVGMIYMGIGSSSTILEDIDPNTFEVLPWGYIKDNQHIYYFDKKTKHLTKLSNVNKDSFEVLTNGYAKDKFYVFRYGELLPEINPNDFKVPTK